jgi:hypothetical protein
MRQPNKLMTVGLLTGLAFALGSCSTKGGDTPPPPVAPPKDATHSAACAGAIGKLLDLGHSSLGEGYQVTQIDGGDCADIYSTTASSHKLLGSVSVGTEIYGPCRASNIGKYIFAETSDSAHTYHGYIEAAITVEYGGMGHCGPNTPNGSVG